VNSSRHSPQVLSICWRYCPVSVFDGMPSNIVPGGKGAAPASGTSSTAHPR
jgi:hypothetical protein